MSASFELHVRLTPKAAQNRVQGWQEDETGHPVLKVSVTAIPEKGKANKALIALLAKMLRVARSDIVIVRGGTDRRKVLKINGNTNDILPKLPPR